MLHNAHAIDPSGAQTPITVVLPSTCPICHKGIEPRVLQSGYLRSATELAVCLRCPRLECASAFIAFFSRQAGGAVFNGLFTHAAPLAVQKSERSGYIEQASPAFCDIFDQAYAAEQYGLLEICGVGYRKALEFLIKDYLIYRLNEPDDAKAEHIKKKLLGKTISEDIKDERIAKVAARATWLGNDETHYVRKWTDRDVSDLKSLIRLTTRWIEMELETEETLKVMPATPS